jgi:hypothetical protein
MAACYMGLRGERRKQSTLGVMVHRDSMDATVPRAITVRSSVLFEPTMKKETRRS